MILLLRRSFRPILLAFVVVIAVAIGSAIAEPPVPADTRSKAAPALDAPAECELTINRVQEEIKKAFATNYSDWILGITDKPPSRDRHSINRSLPSSADGRYSKLTNLERKAIKDRTNVLRRFGKVFAAISVPPSTASQPDVSDLNDAAANLAEYLDDPNAALAESARFWQAVAYWRAGNIERALKTLRPIVSDPVHPRIGFMSRLFRVRLLALSGQPAAALADCNRIADRSDRWFSSYSEATRECARSAVREMQIAVYESWKAKLSESNDESGKKAVAARLAELKKDTLVPDANKRFTLKILIGGLGPFKLPENETPTTTQSATDDK